MRQIAVLFKNFGEADENVRKYRERLAEAGKCDIREFQDPAELDGLLREVFATWWERFKPNPDRASAPAFCTAAPPTVPLRA